MKSPAEQGIFYGNISELLTCAKLFFAKLKILHEVPFVRDKEFRHKKVSVDRNEEYMRRVSSHLV